MLWRYIDFPSLQLNCLQVNKNQLSTEHHVESLQAIVIVDAKKNSIVQLNKVAVNHEIKLGKRLDMAASLADNLCTLL